MTDVKSVQVSIRVTAVEEWAALSEAMTAMLEDRRTPACVVEPDLFFATDPVEVREAVEACLHCPLAPLCVAFAAANKERFGVWGGRVFDRKALERLSDG